ncbi:MAG: prepilin-type N-terminal cleavage/methylation domain-containing protein [Deltaproteobacteria bacterium]|nr:prepilin-type N-terminal cleavage/methylation domain-containing protein [Deltaproteobacteria bacterium]MBW2153165.1 prepilin-type N-terminal cleavage/methylation domain-containing protein [Deltaproteobacteria bacterium]
MGSSSANKDTGFTMIELLIAMAVGLIVLGALSSTFIIQRKTFDAQEQLTEMVQNARAAMDLMTREIRMAGYSPAGANFNGITYDTTQLKIQADLNGDGDTTSGSNEIITYTYDAANDQIDRSTGVAGTPKAVAENIESFTFDYLDGTGGSTTITADIRQVKITIKARTAKTDPSTGQYRTYTLSSVITPINLAL